MPEFFEFHIEGLQELERKLELLPPRVANRVLRNACKAGNAIWRAEMELRVRQGPHHFPGGDIDFGVIAKTLRSRVTVTPDFSAVATVSSGKSFWAKFVEFGTEMRYRKSGAPISKMPEFPFMRPAFESKKQEVLDQFLDEMRTAIRAEGLAK